MGKKYPLLKNDPDNIIFATWNFTVPTTDSSNKHAFNDYSPVAKEASRQV
jgi:hypothetical protein